MKYIFRNEQLHLNLISSIKCNCVLIIFAYCLLVRNRYTLKVLSKTFVLNNYKFTCKLEMNTYMKSNTTIDKNMKTENKYPN